MKKCKCGNPRAKGHNSCIQCCRKYSKKWRDSEKGKAWKNNPVIKELQKKHRQKNKKLIKTKLYDREYAKKYNKALREEVIRLYSHGTMVCRCGANIDNLHHTNPGDGKWEKAEFGAYNTAARKHQIEMYTINPGYIAPLCNKCHTEEHRKLEAVA